MAFEVVTIADRISQYPDRRRLTKEDNTSELVTVSAEEGSVSVEGTEWGAAYANGLEDRIKAETDLLEGNLGKIETTSTAANSYAVGECLVYNGQWYKVTAPISVGNTLTVGTNIAVHSVSAINSNLSSAKSSLSGNNVLLDTGTDYRTLKTPIELSDSIFNYGFLVIEIGKYSDRANQYSSIVPVKNQKVGGYINTSLYLHSAAFMSMTFKIIDDTHIQIDNITNSSSWGTDLGLNNIYGL